MKLLNFGSLNYDYVYSVDHIVNPGETISSTQLEVFCGGKGLNQSIALSNAGASVFHAGMVGDDGGLLLETCKEHGIDTRFIRKTSQRTGNAIIQVSKSGENSIVLFGGANRQNEKEFVDEVLSHFQAGDLILLQNEINLINYIIEQAYAKQMVIALNPSPYNETLEECDLSKVSLFLLNEVEGEQITGEHEPDRILDKMIKRYPTVRIVLTLGKQGVMYKDSKMSTSHGIYKVKVVDTTAAGDTFTGYFLSSILEEKPVEEALRLASVASAIAVSRKGAVASIPFKDEVVSSELSL